MSKIKSWPLPYSSYLLLSLLLALPLCAFSEDKVIPADVQIFNAVAPDSEQTAPFTSEPETSSTTNPLHSDNALEKPSPSHDRGNDSSDFDQRLANAAQLRAEQDNREAAQAAVTELLHRHQTEQQQRKASDDALAAATARVAVTQIAPEQTENPAARMLLILLAILVTCGFTWWYKRHEQ